MKKSLEISIDQIKPNKYQPRTEFDSDAIFELAQSIRENGLIQPIVVRQTEDSYEIVAGERRYRACMMAGLTMIPAIVMDATDQQSAELALIENIQRENLSAVEEAKAYKALLIQNGYTQEVLASKMGKAQSTIANKLRLLELDDEILQAVNERTITERHARALLSVKEEDRVRILKDIIKKKFTVKETEQYIHSFQQQKQPKEKGNYIKGFSRHQQIAVNTIKQAVEMSRKMGIKCEMEEAETIFDRRIIIKFPKE